MNVDYQNYMYKIKTSINIFIKCRLKKHIIISFEKYEHAMSLESWEQF